MNHIRLFDRRAKLALLERLIRARLTGDVCGFADCFTEDAVVWLAGSPIYLPFAGRRVGRDSLMQAIRFFDAELRQYDNQVDAPIIDGDQAALRFRMTIQSRGGGDPAPTKCFAHLRFGDWLIKELVLFIDTALVIDLVYSV